MTENAGKIYEFGDFRLNAAEQILSRRGGEAVALTPKVFQLLLALIENQGHLLSKDELIKTLWADSFVEEANLNVNVSALRRALGEKPNENRYIETVPRRGYRFVAEVREVEFENETNFLSEKAEIKKAFSESETREISLPFKQCPKCRKIYYDASLNFCLEDGERLRAEALSGSFETGGLKSFALQNQSKIWIVLGAVIIAATAFIVWKYAFQTNRTEVSAIRTFAVLPFKPLVGSGTDGALEMGMADALITKLSRLEQITVRPTSTVAKYGENTDPLAAGRELQVEAVLDGRVQRADNRIRVTVQLLRVADGATLWAESFDDFFTNIFAVQDSISEKMTSSLALKISGREKELLAKRYTENTEAYNLYLQGRYHHERISREGTIKAIEFYEAAVQKDPEYALAYAWMTGALAHLVNLNIDRETNLQKARDAAARAVSLDPKLPDAHEAVATVKDFFDWNWEEAEREYRRAIELDPKNADAHFSYSLFLSRFRRHNEAVREVEIARQLNPTAMYIQNQVAQTLLRARLYDEAIAESQKAIETKPDNIQAYGQLVRLYVFKSMTDEAEKALKKYLEFNVPGQESMTAAVYLKSGRKSEGEKILRELAAKYKEGDNCTAFALYYLRLGDKDRVFEFLEKAFLRREPGLTTLNVEPEWDELHSDPRFQDLFRRIGLPLR